MTTTTPAHNCVGNPCFICFPTTKTNFFVFPQDEPTGEKFQRQGGMDLRDYFAAQVAPYFLEAAEAGATDEVKFCLNDQFVTLYEFAARRAYDMADAMMKAKGA